MSASKGGQGDPKGGRTPRAQNADVTERHREQGMPPAAATDASTAARSAPSGGNGAPMTDPDMPTAKRAAARSASRTGEGRSASAGTAQGPGAGQRRRSGSQATSKGSGHGSANKSAMRGSSKGGQRGTQRGSGRGR